MKWCGLGTTLLGLRVQTHLGDTVTLATAIRCPCLPTSIRMLVLGNRLRVVVKFRDIMVLLVWLGLGRCFRCRRRWPSFLVCGIEIRRRSFGLVTLGTLIRVSWMTCVLVLRMLLRVLTLASSVLGVWAVEVKILVKWPLLQQVLCA